MEKDIKSFKELLSRSFATLEADRYTGEKKTTTSNGTPAVTGRHYLADYEIEALVDALRKTVANQPQE